MKKKLLVLLLLPLLLVGCSLFEDDEKEPTEIEKEPTIIEIQNEITEVYKTIESGCVGIYATNETSGSTGSGVVYKENNGLYYVITNYHVIEDMSAVKVFRGGSKYYKANVVGYDSKNDLAVLTFSLDLFGGSSIYIQDIFSYEEEIVSVGQTVLAIGCPLGLENYNTLTTGVVSRVTKSQVQTNAEINPGNSGGGLFNLSGRLIGINTEKEVYTQGDVGGTTTNIPVEGLGYAISLDVVKKCIKDIENKQGPVGRPLLGITVTAVNRYISSEELVELLPNSVDEALVVIEVANGAGKNAGIKVNDVILTADGYTISTLDDLSYYLNLKNIDETFVLELYNGALTEKTRTVSVQLTNAA